MAQERVAGSERIIVALDTQEVSQATAWVALLRNHVGAFKVGLEFLFANGPDGVRAVQEAGASRLFIDSKFSDIPNTVAGALRATCALRPWMLNVHANCGARAMEAARAAADAESERLGVPRPLVIGVTVLTSLDAAALTEIGVAVGEGGVEAEVVRLARLAQENGLDGVVASPLEIGAIRAACGPEFVIVTPGVRPAGTATNDQARVATPAAAVRDGADYLVIGRAITAAEDPRAAVAAIAAEIKGMG